MVAQLLYSSLVHLKEIKVPSEMCNPTSLAKVFDSVRFHIGTFEYIKSSSFPGYI